jgi:hypothetical protein
MIHPIFISKIFTGSQHTMFAVKKRYICRVNKLPYDYDIDQNGGNEGGVGT